MPVLSSRSLTFAVPGYALLGACALLVAGCDRQSGRQAQPQESQAAASGELSGTIDRSRKGSELPDFTFKDPAGKELHLAGLKGKPLLINLWATWCGPCVAELPMLEKLAADRAGELKVLTVSQDLADPAKVAAFLTDRGITRLEPWLDPDNALSTHYATGTLPTTIYYDAEGREVWRFVGGHDWSNAETAKMLAEK